MEVWDDDPEVGDDSVDNFTIAMLSSNFFHFNDSRSLTVHGIKDIGNLALAFYNLTTNPTLCNSGDNPTHGTSSIMLAGNFCDYV